MTGGAAGEAETGTGGSAGAPSAVPACDHASGSITLAPMTFLADGETFTLGDGVNDTLVFEFDFNRDGVTSGNVEIDVDANEDQFALATTIAEAVNAMEDDYLRVTAAIGEPSTPEPSADSARVILTSDLAGARGNVAITTTVANPGFSVAGLSGGLAVSCAEPASCTSPRECATLNCHAHLCAL